ncbi:MAG: hypothetical protein WBH86_04450 [Thermogutta sp.]|nr:hypothetical protein [Thermogutta sp.]HOP78196.1 hypothetical protein [Thermogutta sp.]HPU06728.1 hypothetical protein [Thermogutta sp.]HPZ82472.1 hypothetical protein [Thermogutta sp.]HQF13256.1 hypothetical protein [Thermogutta sp.]
MQDVGTQVALALIPLPGYFAQFPGSTISYYQPVAYASRKGYDFPQNVELVLEHEGVFHVDRQYLVGLA